MHGLALPQMLLASFCVFLFVIGVECYILCKLGVQLNMEDEGARAPPPHSVPSRLAQHSRACLVNLLESTNCTCLQTQWHALQIVVLWLPRFLSSPPPPPSPILTSASPSSSLPLSFPCIQPIAVQRIIFCWSIHCHVVVDTEDVGLVLECWVGQ